MVELVQLQVANPSAIEALLDVAFGADRHQKTAYRLRHNSQPIAAFSFALLQEEYPIASIQCWPVCVETTRLILVGPVAVHPSHQNMGHGNRLMQHMLAVAHEAANPPMVMVGDAEYYGRFGFSADATAGWEMPGPWEPHRLLVRNPARHALPVTGMLERADAL